MEAEKEKVIQKDPKVIQVVDNWYIGGDQYCLTLYKKNRVGSRAKAENVGKDSYTAVGYYTTLDAVLAAIVNKHMLEAVAKPSIKTMEDLADDMRKFIAKAHKVTDAMIEKMRLKVEADG